MRGIGMQCMQNRMHMYKSNTIHRVVLAVPDLLNEQDNTTSYSEEGLMRVSCRETRLFFTVDFDCVLSKKLISVFVAATVLALASLLKMFLLLGKCWTSAELIAGCLSFLWYARHSATQPASVFCWLFVSLPVT